MTGETATGGRSSRRRAANDEAAGSQDSAAGDKGGAEAPTAGAASTPEDSPHRQRLERAKERLASLPLGVRITLFLVGWTLLLAGIAGLFLPVLQGAVMLLAGAAVLSLVSELIYEWLRLGLGRWPKLWRRIEAFRLKTYRRLRSRWRNRTGPGDEPGTEAGKAGEDREE